MKTNLADFILEEVTKGFDNFLEIDIVRQTSHIVVRFDGRRLSAQTGLYYIGINGPLHQIVHLADLLGLCLKDTDELLADDLALSLRFLDTSQFLIEAVLGVDADEIELVGALRSEDSLDLVSLILAQEPMVDEDTG